MPPLPVRKPTRLKGFDYSSRGAYFITVCVKNRAELLCEIIPAVGDAAHGVPQFTAHGVPSTVTDTNANTHNAAGNAPPTAADNRADTENAAGNIPKTTVPRVRLTPYGEIVKRRIENISTANPNVFVDIYVIMPNHIHLILVITKDVNVDGGTPDEGDGTPRAASPTKAVVAKTINALKGLTSKEAGFSIWQRTYHDHIIRNEPDYIRIAEYVENNPRTWRDDCFYAETKAS